jgi:hypothetical protein
MPYMLGPRNRNRQFFNKRGRKNLVFDPQILFDAFGENIPQTSGLKLYVDHEVSDDNLKVFSKKEHYPFEQVKHLQEMEIVYDDITQGNENNNNSKYLFFGPLASLNDTSTKKGSRICRGELNEKFNCSLLQKIIH